MADAMPTQTADAKPVPPLSMADLVKGDDYAGYRNPPAYYIPRDIRQQLANAEAASE